MPQPVASHTRSLADIELDYPYPPRFRWLKRLLLTALALLLMLIVLRLIWGQIIHRRLAAEIARIRAAGEPIMPEDFVQKPMPDEDNAAFYIRRAFNSLKLSPAQAKYLKDRDASSRLFNPPSISSTDLALAKSIKDACAPALADIRRARACSGASWRVRLISPVNRNYDGLGVPGESIGNVRRLLTTMCAYEHEIGDDSAALEIVRDMLSLWPGRMHHLGHTDYAVSMLFMQASASDAGYLAFRLSISTDGATTRRTDLTPASSEQIRSAIAALLDDGAIRQAYRDAALASRMFVLDEAHYQARQRPVIGPYSEAEACRLARVDTLWLNAGTQSTWPAARRIADGIGAERSAPILAALANRVGVWSDNDNYWSRGRCENMFIVLAERHLAAVALAARLYAIDHEGGLPSKLDQLVPTYLPSVPSDPLAPIDRPLSYVSPIVYSFGWNGIDNGGAISPTTRPGTRIQPVYEVPPFDLGLRLNSAGK